MSGLSSREARERLLRKRNELKQYYNMGDSPTKKPSRPSEARASNLPPEMDIESERFDVEAYTTRLLQQESLRGLYEKDTALRVEMRTLDGELQDLVCTNYTKFISATDAIKKMKENVTDMDAKLNALSSNVETIDSVSRVIAENLHKHRSKIDEMLQVNRMLEKIQFLVSLPHDLQKDISERHYHEAVRKWVNGDAVFSRHQSFQSFSHTHAQCRDLAARLYQEIRETVENTPLDAEANIEAVRVAIEDLRLLLTTSIVADEQRPSPEAFDDLVLSSLLAGANKELAVTVDAVQRTIADDFVAKSPTIATQPSNAEQTFDALKMRDALDVLRSACDQFAIACRRALEMAARMSDKDHAERVASVVQPVLVAFSDHVAGNVYRLVQHVIATIVDPVLASRAAAAGGDGAVPAFVGLGKLIHSYMITMRAIADKHLHVRNANVGFSQVLAKSMTDVVVRILSTCQAQLDAPLAAPQSEVRAQCMTPLLYGVVAKHTARYLLIEIETGNAESNPFRAAFTDVARQLVHRSIALLGQYVTNIVLNSFSVGRWNAKSEPTEPSAYAKAMVEEWGAVFVATADLFKKDPAKGQLADDGAKHRRVPSSTGSTLSHQSSEQPVSRSSRAGFPLHAAFNRKEHHALMSDVDRLFSKTSAVVTLQPQTLDALHIVECVIVYSVKSMVEGVRGISFSKGGFQQLQVDTTYLLTNLAAKGGIWFKKEEQRIIGFLNEALTCAHERCDEKVPLAPTMIERLANA